MNAIIYIIIDLIHLLQNNKAISLDDGNDLIERLESATQNGFD